MSLFGTTFVNVGRGKTEPDKIDKVSSHVDKLLTNNTNVHNSSNNNVIPYSTTFRSLIKVDGIYTTSGTSQLNG